MEDGLSEQIKDDVNGLRYKPLTTFFYRMSHCKRGKEGEGEWVEAKIIKFRSIDLAQLHARGDP